MQVQELGLGLPGRLFRWKTRWVTDPVSTCRLMSVPHYVLKRSRPYYQQEGKLGGDYV